MILDTESSVILRFDIIPAQNQKPSCLDLGLDLLRQVAKAAPSTKHKALNEIKAGIYSYR